MKNGFRYIIFVLCFMLINIFNSGLVHAYAQSYVLDSTNGIELSSFVTGGYYDAVATYISPGDNRIYVKMFDWNERWSDSKWERYYIEACSPIPFYKFEPELTGWDTFVGELNRNNVQVDAFEDKCQGISTNNTTYTGYKIFFTFEFRPFVEYTEHYIMFSFNLWYPSSSIATSGWIYAQKLWNANTTTRSPKDLAAIKSAGVGIDKASDKIVDATAQNQTQNLNWFQRLWNSITTGFNNLTTWFSSTSFGQALISIGTWFQNLGDKIGGFFTTLWTNLSSKLDGIKDLFNGNALEDLFDDFGYRLNEEGLQSVVLAPLDILDDLKDYTSSTNNTISFTIYGKTITLPDGDTIWNKLSQSGNVNNSLGLTFRGFWNIFLGGLIMYRLLLYAYSVIHHAFRMDNDKVEVINL